MKGNELQFLGLPKKERVSYQQAKAVVVPFGLEQSVSYGGGTAIGPIEMLKASYEVELFDERFWCEPHRNIGIYTVTSPTISKKSIKDSLTNLERVIDTLLDDGKFPFVFGGEHSITAGIMASYAKRFENVVLLHFDAHADLRDGYLGERYSHASAIRRCLDFENISVVSLGIRNISHEEAGYLNENKDRVCVFWAKDKQNFKAEQLIPLLKDKDVYITFDVDGFDASLMPATGTPEPGGLFWHDVIEALEVASEVSNIIGADINELAPIENFHGPNFVAAKLAYKILSYAFKRSL